MASTGEVWKLGHRPALDGVRGVAILLVLVGHLHLPGAGHAPAVGVTMFFALSGFLITALLLQRRERLTRFYLRRAARLMPAMLACIVLYLALRWIVVGTVTDWRMILGALTYTSNWLHAAGNYDPSSGVAHLWSLAVEEQFYLLWPVALLALRRTPRRWLLVALAAAIGAGLIARLYWWQTAGYLPAYYRFDSRADQLLIGCALAVALHGSTARRLPGWLAVPFMVAAAVFSGTGDATATRWMPTAVALLTVAAILVLVNSDRPPLTAAWLAWFGRRSYGLYLYHLPVRWAVEQYVTDWRVVAPVVLGMTLLLAEGSWRLLEAPVLRLAHAREAAQIVDRRSELSGGLTEGGSKKSNMRRRDRLDQRRSYNPTDSVSRKIRAPAG